MNLKFNPIFVQIFLHLSGFLKNLVIGVKYASENFILKTNTHGKISRQQNFKFKYVQCVFS